MSYNTTIGGCWTILPERIWVRVHKDAVHKGKRCMWTSKARKTSKRRASKASEVSKTSWDLAVIWLKQQVAEGRSVKDILAELGAMR